MSKILAILQYMRSMRRNFDPLVLNLEGLSVFRDIIFLTETWIHEQELGRFCLDGYDTYANCNESYRAGGVAVFLKKTLVVTEVKCVDMRSADCLFLSLRWGNDTLSFLCIYRLQSIPSRVFVDELEMFLSQSRSENILIVGDINLNILESSPDVDNYLFTISSHGFSQCLNEPTRISGDSSTCIDHVMVKSCPSLSVGCYVEHLGITDHALVGFEIEYSGVKQNFSKSVSSQVLNIESLKVRLLGED